MISIFISLILFNIGNAFIDSTRIKRGLKIHHWLNAGLYILCIACECILGHLAPAQIILLCIWAMAARQIFFDIPLNLRRGLKWDYVSLDKPPKALNDRIEVKLWGYNGRIGVAVYSVVLIITTILLFVI